MQWPSDEFLEIKPPSFSPYVYLVTSRRMPTSIAMAAVAGGGMKTIDLPAGTTINDLPKVQNIVRKHYVKNEGQCALFGVITGFLFVFSPTAGILLDVDGNEIGRKDGRFWPQSISIQDHLLG
jgi:hypothetical protein